MKFVTMLIGFAIGFGLAKYSRQIVQITGRSSWAEVKLGPGGTQQLLKIIGMIVITLAFFNWTGHLQTVGETIASWFM